MKLIDIMSQIKYYKSKDVSNMTSLKILNDGVLYALKKKKIVTMKWIFSISIRKENIIFQGHIFTNKDVSLLVKILIKPILTNR